MDDPDKILSKIMNFERTYTPQFTDLIKQSLIAHVDIDTELDNNNSTSSTYKQSLISDRHSFQSPIYDPNITKPNIESHAMSLSQPLPSTNKYKKHQHKATPIMTRSRDLESSKNTIKIIDTSSFIIGDDLEYNSNSDNSDSNSDSEEDVIQDPLIEEYDNVSHEIHKSKLKLRKLDRQITIAERQNQSQSVYVKQHSDIKIKIAQLISKRRQLETHDVVKAYIKEEENDNVEINETSDLNDLFEASTLMEINEDEEEEDEIKHNTISPSASGSGNNNMKDNSINIDDDYSITTSTINDFDYSYDNIQEEDYHENDDDDEEPLTGSVKFHSDNSDNDSNDADDGGGSVKYNSGSESDESGGSMKIHGSDSTQSESNESSSGGGSVQLNDDIENNENWVENLNDNEINLDGEEEENEHKNDENNNKTNAIDNLISTISDTNNNNNSSSSRNKRLEQMKNGKNYKDFSSESANDKSGDLDDLKNKYRNRRRHREQISEIDTPFDFNDLIKGIDDVDIVDINNDSSGSGSGSSSNDIDDDVNDITSTLMTMQYKVEEDDNNDTYPSIPEYKNNSNNNGLLLPINQFSAKLTNIVEEEECFQTIEYQTDSDCDSNDSIVVKKEIIKNVDSVDSVDD